MRISYQYKIRKRVISGGELLPYLNLKTELKKTNITNEEIAHVLRLRTEDVLDNMEGLREIHHRRSNASEKKVFLPDAAGISVCTYSI
mgnify:CR=1 FL=1